MTQAKLYRLEGIVLGRRDQGEADRVILLLAPTGRVDLLARGIRKLRSRKAGHLELFCRTTLLVSSVKDSWDIISQAEALAVHAGLRDDFLRGTYARYVAELVLRFFEGETEEELYTLVDAVFDLLEETSDPERVVRWYEQRLLSLAGFRPEWDRCVGERGGRRCNVPLHPRPEDPLPYGVDPERGGALCPDCLLALQETEALGRLSPSALSWLQAFQRRDYEELAERVFPERTASELRRVMERYISYHLERRPATLRMMRPAKNGNGV